MPKSKLVDAIVAMQEAGIDVPAELRAQALQAAEDARKPKVVTTRKVKKVFAAEKAVPPPGFRWVYNRLGRPYEEMFNGMVYRFDAYEFRLLSNEVANFLFNASIVKLDPTTRVLSGLRALALDPYHQNEERESIGWGEPLAEPNSPELIDRSKLAANTAEVIPVGEARNTYLPR